MGVVSFFVHRVTVEKKVQGILWLVSDRLRAVGSQIYGRNYGWALERGI